MWKDTTPYAANDKERKPTTFTAESGQLEVTITCGHIDYPGVWVMNCHRLQIDTFPLVKADSLESAKWFAVFIINNTISRLLDSANELDQDVRGLLP